MKDSPYLLHTSLFLHLTYSLWRLGGIGCTDLIVPGNVGEYFQSLHSIILKGEGRGDKVVLLIGFPDITKTISNAFVTTARSQ